VFTRGELGYGEGMSNHAEWVVVFRSMDPSARQDAQDAQAVLLEAGFTAELLDDSDADAPPGSYAVRVPGADEAAALAALQTASAETVPAEPGDPSAAMDLETIFEGQSTTAELEALSIEAVLKANDIPCVVQSASEIPTLPFAVLVPKREVERAKALLAEARASGAEAAEAAQPDAV
jgi:hypothetical protein